MSATTFQTDDLYVGKHDADGYLIFLNSIGFKIFGSGWLKKCIICIICFVIFAIIALVAIILGLIPIYVGSSDQVQFKNFIADIDNAFQNDLRSTNLYFAILNNSNLTNATSEEVNAYIEGQQNQIRNNLIKILLLPIVVKIQYILDSLNTTTRVSFRSKRDIGVCDAAPGQNILTANISINALVPNDIIAGIVGSILSDPSNYSNITQTVCDGPIVPFVPRNASTLSSTAGITFTTISTSASISTQIITTTLITTGSTVTTLLTTTTLSTSTVSSISSGSTVTTPLTTTAATLKTTTSTLSTTTLTTSKVSSTSAASTTTSEIISSSPSSEFTSSPFSTFTSESSSFSF